MKADSGEAKIMDLDVMKGAKELHSHIGVVPEETNLYERLTIGQNLDLFAGYMVVILNKRIIIWSG